MNLHEKILKPFKKSYCLFIKDLENDLSLLSAN